MKERNKYLKMLHDGHKEPDMYLEVLSEEMAELEEDLIQRRMKFIELLNEISNQMYAYISGKEKLVLRYHTQFKDISKEGILDKYKKNYKRDIFQGTTVDGIHKDDLKIFLDDNDVRFNIKINDDNVMLIRDGADFINTFIFDKNKKNSISNYLIKENNCDVDIDIDVIDLKIDDDIIYIKYLISETNCIYEYKLEMRDVL